MRRAQKDVTPVLDQRQRKVTVLVITKWRIEARKQPPAKHQRKTRREECRCDPMAVIVEILPHEGRPSAQAPTLPSPASGGGHGGGGGAATTHAQEEVTRP